MPKKIKEYFDKLRTKHKEKRQPASASTTTPADTPSGPSSPQPEVKIVSESSQAPSFGFHLIGRPVSPQTSVIQDSSAPTTPLSTFPVDFIALHGINGHPWETWEHDDGTIWLRDLLPQSLPGARVWTYGYPASVFTGIYRGTARDNAHNLLEQILAHTESDPRPIIFICHSLGGIIAKLAIIGAPDFAPKLSGRLKGILFLGTPHKGSSSADLSAALTRVVNASVRLGSLGFAKSPLQKTLLQGLKEGSNALYEMHDVFRKRAEKLPVTSVFETRDTVIMGKSLGIIVNRDSATTFLTQERLVPTPRSHTDICRYSKNEAGEDLWQIVKMRLTEMAKSALSPESSDGKMAQNGLINEKKRKEQIKKLLRTLAFAEMDVREQQIGEQAERAHSDSFDWVLSHDGAGVERPRAPRFDIELIRMQSSFQRWLKEDGGFFWIHGKAASGKSTLMRKIWYDPRLLEHLKKWQPLGRPICAQMFFSYEGTETQRSKNGMMRTLTFQALKALDPMENQACLSILGPHLDRILQRGDFLPGEVSWSSSELQEVLNATLEHASSTQRFFFLIDGLDEHVMVPRASHKSISYHLDTDDEEGRSIRAGYRDLANYLWSLSKRQFVKVCVSSRPWNEFQAIFSGCPSLRLEYVTEHDIATFVRAQITRYVDADAGSTNKDYIEAVTKKASGVFLWVRIVTDIIVDGIVNDLSPSQLMSTLDGLPSKLGGPDGLYMRMLQTLTPQYQARASIIFDLVLAARDDLYAFTLRYAQNTSLSDALALPICIKREVVDDEPSSDVAKLLRSSGGILEMYGPNLVGFIHLSARDFLSRPDVRGMLSTGAQDEAIDSNVALLISCLVELRDYAIRRGHEASNGIWMAIEDGLYYAAQAEASTRSPQTVLLDRFDLVVKVLRDYGCRVTTTSFKVNGCNDIDFVTPDTFKDRHWMSCQPQRQRWLAAYWRDDFWSAAVQANLVLYLQAKRNNGLQLHHKSGRPLLAYAVIPTCPDFVITMVSKSRRGSNRGILGSGFSHPSMIKFLLDWGADPNEIFRYEELGSEDPYSRRLGREQSVWQWALALGMTVSSDGEIFDTWVWQDWLGAMKLLVDFGAALDKTVRCEMKTESHEKLTLKLSVLRVCIHISIKFLDGDSSLPELLIAKGAKLLDGEFREIENLARRTFPYEEHPLARFPSLRVPKTALSRRRSLSRISTARSVPRRRWSSAGLDADDQGSGPSLEVPDCTSPFTQGKRFYVELYGGQGKLSGRKVRCLGLLG